MVYMAISEAQQKAVNKYVKNNYDRINVTFPKGKKAIIQSHVAATGESVNAFINRAVKETMERYNINPAAPAPVAPAEPKNNGLPDYLTPEVLKHIDRSKFAHDTAYQLEIGEIIGINNLSALADWLKNN